MKLSPLFLKNSSTLKSFLFFIQYLDDFFSSLQYFIIFSVSSRFRRIVIEITKPHCALRGHASYVETSGLHRRLQSILRDDVSAMFVMFRKPSVNLTFNFAFFLALGCLTTVSSQCKINNDCKNGYCRSGMCICNRGWWGSLCEFCRLR